jgi:hypothetical protein
VDQFQFEWTGGGVGGEGHGADGLFEAASADALKNLGDVRIDDRVNVVWPVRGVGKPWGS